jgi:uncharacterized repeat protein (TIGR03803 family)
MLALAAFASFVSAQTYTVLYNFGTKSGDPVGPQLSTIAQGRDGSMYSTAPGATGAGYDGTVFRITPAGGLTVLHSFTGPDGFFPYGGVALGTDGNFYGTTSAADETVGSSLGTVFKMTPGGALTTLYRFQGGSDGSDPHARPLQAMDGNYYGTAPLGGGGSNGGYGSVFRITPSGAYMKLHGFAPPGQPMAPLVEGMDGKVYGVSQNLIFTITESGEFQKLFDFNLNPQDGLYPNGPLVEGSDGNFYGTTYKGGANNEGVVFKITRAGIVTVLHNFPTASGDGVFPLGGLVQASDGNFYGTTSGVNSGQCGTIFRISPNGAFATAYNAFSVIRGCYPWVTLIQHTNGLLYGDTIEGGTGGSAIGDGVFFSFDAHLPQFVSLLPGASRVGQTVGIFGQGFTGASAVSFNGTPAQFTVVSDTYLTAPVPSGATTGFVSVTTASGTLNSNRKFQIRPQVTGFSPASGSVGTSVVITGISLGQTARVTFGSTPAASFTQDSATQITAIVPSGAVTGKIGLTTTGAPSYSHSPFTVTQ